MQGGGERDRNKTDAAACLCQKRLFLCSRPCSLSLSLSLSFFLSLRPPLCRCLKQVGTGYTNAELDELNERIRDYAVPYQRPRLLPKGKTAALGSRGGSGPSAWPAWLHPWTMKTDDVPDVFIPPHRSVVMLFFVKFSSSQ